MLRRGSEAKAVLCVRRAETDEVLAKIWGCSSAGRAPALQAGGQEFDPPHLHQSLLESDTFNMLYLEN